MSIYLGENLIGGTATNTISNAHSLLDYKWTDHILNEMCWLRADTFSWQSGKVYKAVYEHLVADLSSATLKTETLSGITITYYVAPDKHKIVLATEAQKVSNVFDSVGTAWWYILDVANKRFKLPRAMHGDIIDKYSSGASWYRLYADGWCEQGSVSSGSSGYYITLLIPYVNTTYSINVERSTNNTGTGGGSDDLIGTVETTRFWVDSTNSNRTYWSTFGYTGRKNSGLTPYQYLYFYVGDYSQSAIEQTAGITSEELANKIDLPDNVTQSSCDFVIDYKAPASADPTWYRLYKSGWVEQGGRLTKTVGQNVAQVVTLPKAMANTYYTSLGVPSIGGGDTTAHIDIVNTSVTQISIYPHWSTTGQTLNWEVKGFAAQ